MLQDRRNHSGPYILRIAPLEATTYLKGQRHRGLSDIPTEPSSRPLFEARYINSHTSRCRFYARLLSAVTASSKCHFLARSSAFLSPSLSPALQRYPPPAHSHPRAAPRWASFTPLVATFIPQTRRFHLHRASITRPRRLAGRAATARQSRHRLPSTPPRGFLPTRRMGFLLSSAG